MKDAVGRSLRLRFQNIRKEKKMEFDFAMLIVKYLRARKLICDALAVQVGKILEGAGALFEN